MSVANEIQFHRCRLCKCIFYASGKTTYCSKCIPKGCMPNKYLDHIEKIKICDMDSLARKRAKERARWRMRMSNPAFREKERLRSLARAKSERKYAKGNE